MCSERWEIIKKQSGNCFTGHPVYIYIYHHRFSNWFFTTLYACNTIHGIHCLEYNALNTMHSIQGIEHNVYNTVCRIHCIVYISYSTMHIL